MSEQITNYLKNRHTKMSNGEEMHRRKISLASAFSYAAGILILASGIIAWILLPSIFDPLTFSQLGIDKQQTLIGSYTFVVSKAQKEPDMGSRDYNLLFNCANWNGRLCSGNSLGVNWRNTFSNKSKIK
jgi:hypothetical protein